MFEVTTTYKDSETEVEKFKDYEKAKSYAKNEIEWENTIDSKVVNESGHTMYSKKGYFHA